MPHCQECGAKIGLESKFCPECGKPILNVPPPPPPSSTTAQAATGRNWKLVAALAVACCIIIIIFVLANPLGLSINPQSNNNPVSSPTPTVSPTSIPETSPLPTNSPTPTPEETLRESWIRVDNWYNDQIVRYIAVRIDTGESYEVNFAVAAANSAPKTGEFALSIPAYGAYNFTVYTAGGLTVWWNSIYLNVDNEGSPARLSIADSLKFSTLENILCSGASGGDQTIPV